MSDERRVTVIILLHGIRTRAFWFDTVAPILETINDCRVKPISYGRYDVIRFLLPGMTRQLPQRRILAEMKAVIESFREHGLDPQVSVIAHSFGTYAIRGVLERDPDLKLQNLVLCGSILPAHYDFATIQSRVHNLIVNEVGFRDIWPVVAKISTFGYGDSGTYGFGCARCIDRHHDLSHDGFFNFPFVHRFWLSLFKTGQIVPSEFNRNSKREPILQRLLSLLPTSFLPWLMFAGLAAWSLYGLSKWLHKFL